MNRDDLERLLSRRLDGDLSADEEAGLASLLASDPEAARIARRWGRLDALVRDRAAGLGGPSGGLRERMLASLREDVVPARRARPIRLVRAVAAAAVLAALGAGYLAGRAGRGAEGPPPGDVALLAAALRETRELLPSRVVWAALCDGALSIGTTPLPMDRAPRYCYVTYSVRMSGDGGPVTCQIAVLEDEIATVTWDRGGRWTVTCRPTAVGEAVRLSTEVTVVPEGSDRGVTVSAEPLVAEGQVVALASSSVGAEGFRVFAEVKRAPAGAKDGAAL